MEKNHFEQAKLWSKSAEYIADSDSEAKYAVAVSMVIHAIIKANDALTFKFMATTARRHDDARRLFEDLIKKNFVKAEYSNYKQIIQDAINNKAQADYRGAFFSKQDFEDMKRKAERFIRMAGEIIR
ncbi:MAG TPA: HEPN domain-containing protein [Candidatus Nanoarchaeia archaeon]|nr:HEPN domain-containing protein [Candidatus Nanoarchaeia archaeon]